MNCKGIQERVPNVTVQHGVTIKEIAAADGPRNGDESKTTYGEPHGQDHKPSDFDQARLMCGDWDSYRIATEIGGKVDCIRDTLWLITEAQVDEHVGSYIGAVHLCITALDLLHTVALELERRGQQERRS